MSHSFVPFTPPKPSEKRQPFQLKVRNGDAKPGAAPGGNHPPSPSPSGSTEPKETVAPSSEHSHSPAPQVNFERDGERITRIRITCSCGRELNLDCEY